jgi:hypothetical protein
MTADEIKKQWVFGANCGSAFHKAAELFLNNPLDLARPLCTSPIFSTIEFGYFLNFVSDEIIGKVQTVRTELRLSDWLLTREGTYAEKAMRRGEYYKTDPLMQLSLPMTKLAGCADFIGRRLSKDGDQNRLVIWDWKRSQKIRYTAYGGKMGKRPCDEMPDCNGSHYNLQLNTYRWLLEHTSGYRVEEMWIVVFHPDNGTYLKYEVPDMQRIVQRLMIRRLRDSFNRDLVAELAAKVPPKKLTDAELAEELAYKAQLGAFLATVPRDPCNLDDYFRSKA